MNVSLFLVGEVTEPHVSGICVGFPGPAQGNGAVPADRSVLLPTGILTAIRWDEIHPFACPGFFQGGIQGQVQ